MKNKINYQEDLIKNLKKLSIQVEKAKNNSPNVFNKFLISFSRDSSHRPAQQNIKKEETARKNFSNPIWLWKFLNMNANLSHWITWYKKVRKIKIQNFFFLLLSLLKLNSQKNKPRETRQTKKNSFRFIALRVV